MSSRAASVTAPVRTWASASAIAAAFASAPLAGSSATAAASPACWERVAHDADRLVRQLGGALGGHDHVRRVGEHDDLLGGRAVDAGQQVVGRGVERRAAVERHGAERAEQRGHAVARHDGQRARRSRRARRPRRRRRGARRARPSAGACRRRRAARPPRVPSNSPVASSGSSVWTWTLSVWRSPTTSTESPIASSCGIHGAGIEVVAGDGEVRAVAVARRVVLGMGDARRRVVLERRRRRRRAARRRRRRTSPSARSRRRPRRPRRAAPAAGPARA